MLAIQQLGHADDSRPEIDNGTTTPKRHPSPMSSITIRNLDPAIKTLAPSTSILEIEKQNFSKEKGRKGQLEPLYCFAISAKRYALFNRDVEGKPIIRKASAHGLGHYSVPYGHEGESRDERGSGVRLWEEDVWKQIISAALSDRPREVDYAFRSEMLRPAHSRYGSTRPAVLNWFKRYNEGRPYAEQVKPFNFLLTFFTRRQEDIASEDLTHEFDPKLDEI